MEINKEEIIKLAEKQGHYGGYTMKDYIPFENGFKAAESYYKAIIEERELLKNNEIEGINKEIQSLIKTIEEKDKELLHRSQGLEVLNTIVENQAKELSQAKELLKRCLHSSESYTLKDKISEFLKK